MIFGGVLEEAGAAIEADIFVFFAEEILVEKFDQAAISAAEIDNFSVEEKIGFEKIEFFPGILSGVGKFAGDGVVGVAYGFE